jgi:hypothetical protein
MSSLSNVDLVFLIYFSILGESIINEKGSYNGLNIAHNQV